MHDGAALSPLGVPALSDIEVPTDPSHVAGDALGIHPALLASRGVDIGRDAWTTQFPRHQEPALERDVVDE